MQQDSLNLIKFQKKFSTEKACQNIFFVCVGPQVLSVPAVVIGKHPLFGPGGFINVALAVIKPH